MHPAGNALPVVQRRIVRASPSWIQCRHAAQRGRSDTVCRPKARVKVAMLAKPQRWAMSLMRRLASSRARKAKTPGAGDGCGYSQPHRQTVQTAGIGGARQGQSGQPPARRPARVRKVGVNMAAHVQHRAGDVGASLFIPGFDFTLQTSRQQGNGATGDSFALAHGHVWRLLEQHQRCCDRIRFQVLPAWSTRPCRASSRGNLASSSTRGITNVRFSKSLA